MDARGTRRQNLLIYLLNVYTSIRLFLQNGQNIRPLFGNIKI